MGRAHTAPWPAIPADAATICLFTTRAYTLGGVVQQPSIPSLSEGDIESLSICFLRHNKASAANGIRCYAFDQNGQKRETDLKNDAGAATIGSGAAVGVGALAAGAEFRKTFNVSHLNGFCFEYTAGADNPEEWDGVIKANRRTA